MVLRLPAGLAAEDAVFVRLMGVSMSTLTTTKARPPARVIVAGLGPVGHLAAKIFAACGYEVCACDPDASRRELALQSGIKHVEAAMPQDDPEWHHQTALVVECSGHEQSALDGCRMVAKGGEVVLVGVPWRQRTELSAHELLKEVFHRYVNLRSGWEWELPKHAGEFQPNSIFNNYRAALTWLADGRVGVHGLAAYYSPVHCQDAYQALLHNTLDKLAVVFDWTQVSNA
jgi:threonine dehydrogenase-like Zn-dependent dehydrogenase